MQSLLLVLLWHAMRHRELMYICGTFCDESDGNNVFAIIGFITDHKRRATRQQQQLANSDLQIQSLQSHLLTADYNCSPRINSHSNDEVIERQHKDSNSSISSKEQSPWLLSELMCNLETDA